jgi:hypothetical protein
MVADIGVAANNEYKEHILDTKDTECHICPDTNEIFLRIYEDDQRLMP